MPHQFSAMQVQQISNGLLAVAERTHALADALRQAGFSAFAPYQEFMESFATSSLERDVHRAYLQERAKGMLSIADARYTSPLMERLREGAAASYLRNDPATEWIARLHVDPCEQNALLLKVRNGHEYERRERTMLERRASQLSIETARHSTGMATGFPAGMLLKPMRFNFAARVLERESAPLGFQRVRSRVAKTGVVVSKPVAAGWDLDWSIASPDLFYFSTRDGSLTLNLKLRARGVAKADNKDVPGAVFEVKYPALVYGFSTAYMPFRDLDSLETILKAHVQLYRLVAGDLERVVAEAV